MPGLFNNWRANNSNNSNNDYGDSRNTQPYTSARSNPNVSRISTYPGQRIIRGAPPSANTRNNGSVGIGVSSDSSRNTLSSINNGSTRTVASHENAHYVTNAPINLQNVIRGTPPSASYTQRSAMPTVPPRSNSDSTMGSFTHQGSGQSYVQTPNTTNLASSTQNSNTTTATSRPGAYSVSRSSSGPEQVYRVTVPSGVVPGSEFAVHAGSRRVRVRCPATSRPGNTLQITLPPEAVSTHKLLRPAPLTRACPDSNAMGDQVIDPFMRQDPQFGNGGAKDMSQEVIQVNRNATSGGGTAETYLVTIPDGIYPGMTFNVNAGGQKFKVTCPPNAGPNSKVRIVAPTVSQNANGSDDTEPLAAPKMQIYEVIVPQGVRPNQPFTLMANNQRVLVTCPPNVVPGQKIRFQLPLGKQPLKKIQLSYKDNSGSSGWERTIRVTDMKFQWVRVDEKKDDDEVSEKLTELSRKESSGARKLADMEAFDFSNAAYVRKIQFLEGNDARLRTGIVTLVPAQEAIVNARLVDYNYHGTNQPKTLFTYNDIAEIQGKSLDQKIKWFQEKVCEELYTPWEKGHVKIVVRRAHLLEDSVNAIMALSRDDMRRRWRIDFAGEPGIEAGGLTREWFQLVTEQIFDPDRGLWLSSVNNQMSMQINPASHILCPDDYLKFFRVLGRIMGRALFDRQLIKGHMVRHLYKHLLGWPITFDDLEAQDEEYYTSLKKFTTMEDPSIMCLDFTVTEETLGVRKDIELVPGGAMKEVTSENVPEYLEANLKYRMLNQTKPQTTELLLGFFDIIPEAALTIFDPNELELILCGLPVIDMDDWMDNTKYSGYYESKGKRHQVVEWFWDVVKNDFDQEMKARLLQFVTGTSGVPPRGFSVLQGNDGNIKKFCVHGVSIDQYFYPRAHTCFNRIDLPNYSSKNELRERLRQAVSLNYVGFGEE